MHLMSPTSLSTFIVLSSSTSFLSLAWLILFVASFTVLVVFPVRGLVALLKFVVLAGVAILIVFKFYGVLLLPVFLNLRAFLAFLAYGAIPALRQSFWISRRLDLDVFKSGMLVLEMIFQGLFTCKATSALWARKGLGTEVLLVSLSNAELGLRAFGWDLSTRIMERGSDFVSLNPICRGRFVFIRKPLLRK